MSLATEIAADSPWGYWKFDDASGTTIADSSGNSHPATLSGTTVTYAETELASGLGNCMKLLGNDSPTVTLPSGFNNSPFTFEAVIKPTSFNSPQEQGFFTTGGASEFLFRMSGAGKPDGSMQMGINGSRPATTTGVLANNVAHHIAFTYPNSGAASVIYLDGLATTLDGSGVMSTNQTLAGTMQIFHNNARFRGWVQHCAVYQTELTAQRILDHAVAAGFAAAPSRSRAPSRLKRPVFGGIPSVNRG